MLTESCCACIRNEKMMIDSAGDAGKILHDCLRQFRPLCITHSGYRYTQCWLRAALLREAAAVAGVLDLGQWDFEKDGPVNFSGQWEFHWEKLLGPGDFASLPSSSVPYIAAPAFWNREHLNGKKLPGQGYATYRLRVRLPQSGGPYALIIAEAMTSNRVFVNGHEAARNGVVAVSATDSRPRLLSEMVSVDAPDKEVEMVVQISNFHHQNGGMAVAYRLGLPQDLRLERESERDLEFFVFGILLIMGLYHLTLYALRRSDRSALFFGCFCLLIALRTLVMGQRALVRQLPDWPFEVFYKPQQMAYFLAVPLFIMYAHSLFPARIHWLTTRIVLWLGLLFSAVVVFTPSLVYSYMITVWNVLTAIAGVYMIAVVGRAVYTNDDGARLFLGGFVAFFATIINDILFSLGILHTFYATPFGLVIFVFAQAALLARRFAGTFRRVEVLSTLLEKQNADLTRVDQLKDEFLANTSHELRTPLNGIIGLAESLIQGVAGDLGPKANQNLNMITVSGKRLANLVNDILDFSKLKNHEINLQSSSVDVRSMTDLVLTLSRTLVAGKNLMLVNNIPADLPLVQADENRLQQILFNLIGNAIKFTHEGEVAIGANIQNSDLRIFVSDTGIGIPSDKLDSIFQSFEQADGSIERQYGGTGLGLAVTKSLVELHGGKIWADSVPGKGSTFFFTLPVALDQNAPAALTAAEQEKVSALEITNLVREDAIPRRQIDEDVGVTDHRPGERDRQEAVITNVETNLKVLVVDDEPINLQVIINNLSLAGMEVTQATSGEKAIESLKATVPDLILLDVMMPRMNGYDTAKKIREKYSLDVLPIIFLTARNQVNALVEGYAAGGNDFIAKPFSRNELLSRINIHVKLARLLKQERFSVIGQMAGGIVHDLKNPITIIKAYAEMVRDFGLGEERKKEYLTIIESEADRLSDMAHSILDFVKGEIVLNLETVDLKQYLDDAANFIKPVFDDDSKHLHWQIDNNGMVTFDQDRMRRVIINLANNAREVLHPGGNFTIHASRTDRLLLQFTDDGPGIPVEIKGKLFQPFATHGKSSGTGLGLAMVRQIVEAHGGSVTCKSPVIDGKGASFVVVLPVK